MVNTRVVVEGRLDARPGYTRHIAISPLTTIPNSIRRLNDPDHSFLPTGFTYVGGAGDGLYVGPPDNYTLIDPGYSGNPLTLVTFRPEQSPESWMYVYDSAKLSKVRPDGQVRGQGVAPPRDAPDTEYGVPAGVTIAEGDVGTWAVGGTATTATPNNDRTNGSSPVVSNIIYDSGSTGWCVINPTASASFFWAGERMHVRLNDGQPNAETVVVREIHAAITNTTVQGIAYDSGSTGLCSIVLSGSPTGLSRNSIIRIDGEYMRVLSTTPESSGTGYSIRCDTSSNHAAGAPVNGFLSWYIYTVQAHGTGETISAKYVSVSNPASGTGTATRTVSLNASVANGRPISQADDWFHISVFLQNPQFVTSVVLKIDTGDGTFTKNYWTWTIPGTSLNLDGFSPGGDSFTDLSFELSSGVLTGQPDLSSFAHIAAVQVGLVATAACSFGFGSWYFFGTYGPVIQPTDPIGITYESRFRDSTTGARSIPGPPTRYDLFPLREEIRVTPATSSAVGVDQIDIYRFGGAVTQYLYVGSVPNNTISPATYSDSQPDDQVLSVNQPPDLTALQPFTVLQPPWSGIVNVNGTGVEWVSGSTFDGNLVSGTVIVINGVAYQTYGSPRSTTFLEINLSAGVQTGVSFEVASPEIAAQPLPFAFVLDGPFQPVIFALGDPINAGTLYYSNAGDFDTASDANTLEITGPSDPLISGAQWNGLAFVGTREDIYVIRYSFLSSPTPYQWQKIPTNSGTWSRWACCTTPIGVAFLGRDGIYMATDQGAASISDQLYPIFPHEGQAARISGPPNLPIYPVDMTATTRLRLASTDDSLIFSYVDTQGNSKSWRYQYSRKRWFFNSYGDGIATQYLVEGTTPDDQQVLLLSSTQGRVYLEGGDTDDRAEILTTILTASSDGGDERGQKLYVDVMVMADGVGELLVDASYDNATSYSPVTQVQLTGPTVQVIQNISSLAQLGLHKNIGGGFTWTGGPSGPRLYAWEPSGYIQPYLSTLIVTQFITCSYPGWKAGRRFYPALISNSDVFFTVKTQDGRTYGPYKIASTGGQYHILPEILDAGVKDLAFAFELDGRGETFALFPDDFTVEMKGWADPSFIPLAVFKS
jgi:hypothetical protein